MPTITPPSFRAFRIHEIDKKIVPRFDTISLDDLSPGNVVVRVHWSDINYKDALAATGTGRILRQYPLAGGIDLAGVVEHSVSENFKVGDEVLVTGGGLCETRDGGYSQYARVDAEEVIPLPRGLDLHDSMKLGSAGFTAALAIHRMEQNGQRPERGPIIVSGASGGVGSICIDMLARRGYEVVAISGKPDADEYLRSIGAARIVRRQTLELGKKPLENAQWAGAVDNIGGGLLSWLTRSMSYGGNVASIGNAAGADFATSVMPFILRGVNLLGINSSLTPRDLRVAIWERIAQDLRPRHLDKICNRIVEFDDLPTAFADYIQGKVTGRATVRIS